MQLEPAIREFLGKRIRIGIHGDFKTRKVVAAARNPQYLANWGCLKDGREYDITVISLDIAGNSNLVRKLGTRRMEKLYFNLWSFLRDHVARAARFAEEVQSTVPLFNLTASRTPAADISLRLGIDTGKVKFSIETGTIVSDVINSAAHIEKKATRPGMVCISRFVYNACRREPPPSFGSAASSRKRTSFPPTGGWTACSARRSRRTSRPLPDQGTRMRHGSS